MHRFLEVCRQLYGSLTLIQRQDICAYIVPELEEGMDILSRAISEGRDLLDAVINESNKKGKSIKSRRDKIGQTMKNTLHARELIRLKRFHDKITTNCITLVQKRQSFSTMTELEKKRTVYRCMEQIMDEAPPCLARLEEMTNTVDEKLSWKEWKCIFKLTVSKVGWMIIKLLNHKVYYHHRLTDFTLFLHRDQFTEAVLSLGLLEPADLTGTDSDSADSDDESGSRGKGGLGIDWISLYGKQFHMIESLSIPPVAKSSDLSSRCLDLVKSSSCMSQSTTSSVTIPTDMVFEVLTFQDCVGSEDSSTSNHPFFQSTSGPPTKPSATDKEGTTTVVTSTTAPANRYLFPAHCVIVASRCDWFRRALCSGMKESIEKKIIIYDIQPDIFTIFLQFVYSGRLELGSDEPTTEQLADLLTTSDKYEEDHLKCICECALQKHIDCETALYLLGIADQVNAAQLKSSVISYLSAGNSDLVSSDIFQDLPASLQQEVMAAVSTDPYQQRSNNKRGGAGRAIVDDLTDQAADWNINPGYDWDDHSDDECDDGDDVFSDEDDVEDGCGTSHHLQPSVSDAHQLHESDVSIDADDFPAQYLLLHASGTSQAPASNAPASSPVVDADHLQECKEQLMAILGSDPDTDHEELERIIIAADFDVNRAANYYFSSSSST